MKKSLLFTALLSAFVFISCASNDVSDSEIYYSDDPNELSEALKTPEVTENFLGDFNPIKLDSKVVLVKSFGKLVPKELSNTYLIPRRNTIEVTFRYGANNTTFIWNQKDRTAVKEAAERFLAEYEAKELRKHKVSRKTAYYNSYCPLYYGLIGTNNGTSKNEYYINYEIVDKRAYFVIHFVPTRNDPDKGNESGSVDEFTPKTRLYLSPSQLRDFIELLDQDYLNANLELLRQKAYTY